MYIYINNGDKYEKDDSKKKSTQDFLSVSRIELRERARRRTEAS